MQKSNGERVQTEGGFLTGFGTHAHTHTHTHIEIESQKVAHKVRNTPTHPCDCVTESGMRRTHTQKCTVNGHIK